MPKSTFYTLVWSPSYQAYELYGNQRDNILELVSDGTSWSLWAHQLFSFAFHGKNGFYTARKEHKHWGEGYWYAYARVEGKLTKRYLGRSVDLTLTRLEQVAQELWDTSQAALRPKEEKASSQPQPFSSLPSEESSFLPDYPSEAATVSPNDAKHLSLSLDHLSAGGQGTENESNVSGQVVRASAMISGLPSELLLTAKFHIPRPRQHMVSRPRLIQQLQQGLEQTLILLSAPAGFGKTTLLSDWLASSGMPATWLALEPQDNEPTRFFSYLLAALQSYDPQLGTNAQDLLHPLKPTPLGSVLTVLINDLQAWMTGNHEHVVLVLEDYHVIVNRLIHSALAFVLEHLPPQFHLVLSTRQDPPLPLARLRGQGTLLELRATDLRFTPQETATYLREVMGLPLSSQDSALLQLRTEGWITGLQLAAHSLLNHDNPAHFIAAFSGSHHYVADYLLDEVLSRQAPEVQDFLLHTSLLERLSAPLCDAVCGHSDSQAQLDFLDQANLFLVALDNERQWYRYHRLFAEVLHQRLRQTAPTLVADLHHRASRWYEQHGFFTEAVSHALAASAFEDAAHLIEQGAWTLIAGSQMQTLSNWLQALPETLVLSRPWLGLLYAITLMYTNHWEAASTCLQTIEREISLKENSQEGQSLLGQVLACRSLLVYLSGDLEEYVALSHQALTLLPETDTSPLTSMWRTEALFGAAHAYLVSGDATATSEHLLSKAFAFAHISPDYQQMLPRGLTILARLQAIRGQLHQAVATYEEAAQLVKGAEEVQSIVDSSNCFFGLGDILREWNELEIAERYLTRGMDLIKGVVSIDADKLWLGHAAMARLQQAQGRYDQALTTLDTFMQMTQQRHIAPALVAQCAALRAQIELTQDDLSAARHWMATSTLSTIDVSSYLLEPANLTLVRVRITEERVHPTATGLSEVMCLLNQLLAAAQTQERMASVLEISLLRTQVFELQGNHTEALAVLSRTLSLAEPEGYIRLFLDEGTPILALLHQAQQHGPAREHVAKLLAAASKTRAKVSYHQTSHTNSLVEPLTARELDVLRLVLAGASNREIARQLTVSVNTVKKHISNIYGKLNVQSRAQAVAKARVLQLL